MKNYIGVWHQPTYENDTRLITSVTISEEFGYSPENIDKINELEVDEYWSSEFGGHFIRRIADTPEHSERHTLLSALCNLSAQADNYKELIQVETENEPNEYAKFIEALNKADEVISLASLKVQSPS